MSLNELSSENKLLEKKKRKNKILILIPSIIVFSFLTIYSMFYLDVEKSVIINEEEQLIITNDTLKISSEKLIISSNSDSIPLIKNEVQIDTLIKPNVIDVYGLSEIEKDYLVIIGAFKDKINAIHMRDQLIGDSHTECKVVFNGKNLFWVSLGFYDSMDQASKALSDYNQEGWIKKI
jgi:hypothetical protein